MSQLLSRSGLWRGVVQQPRRMGGGSHLPPAWPQGKHDKWVPHDDPGRDWRRLGYFTAVWWGWYYYYFEAEKGIMEQPLFKALIDRRVRQFKNMKMREMIDQYDEQEEDWKKIKLHIEKKKFMKHVPQLSQEEQEEQPPKRSAWKQWVRGVFIKDYKD